MHFNAAGHACDCETMVKQKAHRVNITSTTNPVPVHVPLAWKFHVERIIILSKLTLVLAIHVFRACFIQANPWEIHGLTL